VVMVRIAAVCALVAGLALGWTSPGLAAAPEPPPVEAYGRLPAMAEVDISPSGERLAFVASDAEGRKLFVRTVAGQPLAIVPLADKKLRGVYWGGERFVIFLISEQRRLSVDFPAGEYTAGFVLDVETRKTTPIFGRATKSWDVIMGQYGTARLGGRDYGYFSTFEQTRRMVAGDVEFVDYNPDLFRIDLETGEVVLVNKGGEHTRAWVVDGGAVAARMAYSPRTGAWEITRGESGGALASGVESFGQILVYGLGRTRDSVLVGMWDEDGVANARELSLKDGTFGPFLAADGGSFEIPLYDRDSKLLVGYAVTGYQRRTVYFDPARQALIDKIGRAFAGKRPWVVSASSSQDRVVVYTDGGDDSGSYWLVDLKALKADPLGAAYPRVTPSKVGKTSRYAYMAADGLPMDGVLTLPPGREGKGLPVVVLPHGGPEGQSDLGFDYWAQAYASRGYAVFQPNFRGSTGYGKAFRDAGFGQWGRKMQTDISDGLDALAKAGIVDPKRACIVGSSYGGYAALAGVTVQNGLYRCAVSVAGVADPVFMLESEIADTGGRNAAIRYWRAFLGADRPGWMAELSAVSPARLAARADAPVLLIHGKDDTVVKIEQSRRMERALKAAGKPVEFIVLEGEDHWLSGEVTRTAMLQASVAFVLKHNPPD
jgi:dipeptidyl aminopeptidase/acylaminoacyl peptidase